MDEIFGEMDCRYKADSIMMSLLRSAMDNAHERVQSRDDGPIECLNERSKFYELAIIQIEGSLKLIDEEIEERIPESNKKKMLTDLMELEELLRGRLKEMKFLIIEKDKELIERMENEFRLKQALESKEREVRSLYSKLELERTKSETIQEFLLSHHKVNVDEGKEEDFNELKNSVEKQVLSIKQRLEDERMNFTNVSRKTSATSADFEPEFQSMGEGKKVSCEESKEKDDHSPDRIMSVDDWLRPEQNAVIEQMSSDIDILKGTLDLAFGKMQTVEVRPLEKQWRWSIEKETILIFIKGFIRDLKQSSKAEMNIYATNFPEEMIEEMVKLRGELEGALSIRVEVEEKKVEEKKVTEKKVKGKPPIGSKIEVQNVEVVRDSSQNNLRRTVSEPIIDLNDDFKKDLDVNHGSNYVAMMTKKHESIIRKQQEQLDWLKIKEAFRRNTGGLTEKRENEFDAIERRVFGVITRLDRVIKWKNDLATKKHDCFPKSKNIIPKYPVSKSYKRNTCVETAKKDEIIANLRAERDVLSIQTLIIEENYVILLKGLANDFYHEFCAHSIEMMIMNEIVVLLLHEMAMDWRIDIENKSVEMQMREEIYTTIFVEGLKFELQKVQNKVREGQLEKIIKEDLYAGVLGEMVKESRKKLEDNVDNESTKMIESMLKEDIYMVFVKAMVEEWNAETYAYEIENIFREDIYQLAILEAIKHTDDLMNKNPGIDLDRQTSIEKIDFLLEFSEQIEGDLAMEISSYEDQTTLTLVTEKLEKAMRMLNASKEQLRELARTLPTEPNEENIIVNEPEDAFDTILAPLVEFQQVVTDFEESVHGKLHTHFLRLQNIEQQIDPFLGLLASLRKEELMYKKAFTTRCHNLLLAETEVDLLGDQVEALQALLRKIYLILDKHSPFFSHYFEVMDILELIKKELRYGAVHIP